MVGLAISQTFDTPYPRRVFDTYTHLSSAMIHTGSVPPRDQ